MPTLDVDKLTARAGRPHPPTHAMPRDWHQTRQHLLSAWAESIKRGIATHQRGMPVHFPEFFEGA